MFNGIKVHNIVVGAKAKIDFHFDIIEKIAGVKIEVEGGKQRGNVTVYISCDAGMDRNTCFLAMDKGFGIAKEKLGEDLTDIELKTFEINRDYLGTRIDRKTCITKKGLYDMVERVYQKEQGVRHEWKVSTPMPISDFESLLMGGMSNYNSMQANYMLVQETKRLTDVLKSVNQRVLEQGEVIKVLVTELIKLKERKPAS